jgi:cytochrome c biogenesis protein
MNIEQEQQKKKTVVDSLWDFLASVKLAIIIFAFIALTSIVGTVLEQRADPAKNILILSKLFGESSAPTLYSFFDSLGFMDMYRSWWFKAILVLFSVNIVICSFDRLPRIWKLVKEPLRPMPGDKLEKLLINRQIVMKGKPDNVRSAVTEALKTTKFRFTEVQEEKGYQFYAQKGNYGRLGVYLTHFSILFILIGAMLGMQFGFKGYLNLPEGALSNVAVSNTDKEIPLGFDIRCDTFDVEFYGGSDMPREYKSWLTIFKDGREVMRKSIVVNDPLTYEGITFYQSSYGMVPGAAQRGIAVLNAVSRTGKTATLNLRLGDTFQIPDSAVTGKILDFSPALQLDEHGHAVTYAEMMNNPALLVEFSEGTTRLFSGWLLKRHPETWQLPNGDRVEFLDYWGVEYTGLQVRKDPGVWVVYLGCITMSIGLFIAFFMSHRRIWVKLSEENNTTRVLIGATTNKNKAAVERTIDRIVSVLSKKQEGVK